MLTSIRKSLKCQRGFSLMELVVVIAIIGILAAILIPNLSSSTGAAKNAKMRADMRSIDSALALYYANHVSKYPADQTAYDAYIVTAFPQEPKDTTNTKFSYEISGAGYKLSGKDTGGTAKLSPGSVGYVEW